MVKKENTASVLAFEKKLVPSDGRMYGTIWDQRNDQFTPLVLIEKSVRGTISNRPNKKDKAAFLGGNAAKLYGFRYKTKTSKSRTRITEL